MIKRTCDKGCCQYIMNTKYKKPYGPWKTQKKKAGIINYWYEDILISENKVQDIVENITENIKSLNLTEKENINNKSNTYLLLINSACWKWGFPKGSIEEGETPLKGALREYIEETGINIDKNDLVKVNRHFLVKSSNKIKYYITNKNNRKNIEDKSRENWKNFPYNDSTGIGIFNYDCIISKKLKINLNKSCEKIISKMKIN